MVGNKRIEFGASINAQEFNRELDRIEKRLKAVGADTGITAGLAKVQPQLKNLGINIDKSTSQLFGEKARKGMKDLDVHIKKQIKDLQTLQNIEGQRSNKIKDFQNSLKGLNSESGDFKDIQQSIVNLQEKQNKNLTTQEAKLSSILKRSGQLKIIQQAMSTSPGFGGRLPPSRMDAFSDLMRGGFKQGARFATAGAPLMAGLGLGGQFFQFQADRPMIQAQARAGTIRGAQRTPRAFLEGRGAEEMMFQRTGILEQSLNQARKDVDNQKTADRLRAGAGLTGAALIGAGIGSKLGAAGGTALLPGIGTGLGAVGGGMLGAAGGLGAGMIGLAQTRFGRSLVDPETYNQEINKLTVDKYNQYVTVNKEKIELQRRGMNYIKDRSPSYLNAQRTLGFNDVDLFGGTRATGPMADPAQAFRQRPVQGIMDENADFEEQEVLRTAQNVANVGGARGVRRNTRTALLARRNLNVMGAGQMIGQLQAIGGEGGNAFKKILAEGMTIGLNNSDMSREQERFASTVSRMVFQQGRGTDSGQMASLMATMAGDDPTMRALMATPGAMQGLENLSRNTQGVRGMLQAAQIEKEFQGTKLDIFGKIALQDTGIQEIVSGSSRVSNLAQQAGLSEEEFRRRALETKTRSMTITQESQDIVGKMRAGELKGGDLEAAKGRHGTIMGGTSKVFAGLDQEQQKQISNFLETGRLPEKTMGDEVSLRGKGQERIGDVISRQTGAVQKAFRDLFKEHEQQIRTDFEGATKMAPLTVKFGDQLAKELETMKQGGDEAAAALAKINAELEKMKTGEVAPAQGTQNVLDMLGLTVGGGQSTPANLTPGQPTPQQSNK